jgi:IclR family acetate operon transcriptional repressor
VNEQRVRDLVKEAGTATHTPKTLTDVSAILENLERVRVEGYATDDEEEAEGVCCVGAAFFDHQGKCAGALSVTGLKVDVPLREIQCLGTIVKEHAERMTSLLGGKSIRRTSVIH